ncbi:MAG: hypothetical protein ABIH46_03780 [Chloroflexota bacterium]
MPSETVDMCHWSDAVILGAIGAPFDEYRRRPDAADPPYYRRYLLGRNRG